MNDKNLTRAPPPEAWDHANVEIHKLTEVMMSAYHASAESFMGAPFMMAEEHERILHCG